MQYKINNKVSLYNFRIDLHKAQVKSWQLLLFLMIFIPRTGQSWKLIVLSFLFILSALNVIKTGTLRINKKIAIFLFLHLLYVTFSGFHGLIKSNPGTQDFLRVNLIYYLVLIFILSTFFNQNAFDKSIKTIILSANFVSIYSILLLLVKLQIWPEAYFIYFDITSNVGIHEGYVHLVNTNLSMMIFILPFLITLFLNGFEFYEVSRKQVFFTIVLAVIATLISGRRIIWLSFIIPIFYYLLKYDKKKIKEKFKIISTSVVIILIVIIFVFLSSYLSFELMLDRFREAFDSEAESIRFIQAKALWRGFLENPLFGSGAGIGVNEFIRSSSAPWIYEMTYNLILFNSGIIGFSIFAASHLYLLTNFYKLKKRKIKIGESLFVTYVVVLIASGTNPYFTSSFDFLWFIIFPLMYFYSKKEKLSRR